MITSFFAPKKLKKSKPDNTSNLQEPQSKRIKTTPDVSTSTQRVTLSPNPNPFSSKSKFDSPEVKELLSYLNQEYPCETNQIEDESENSSSSLPPKMNHVRNWHNELIPRLQRNGLWFYKLAKFVANERKTKTIYPPPHQVFSGLNLTPLSKLKVVIVGQDPYHGPDQGHGLCFSVRKGVRIPPSLRNIYKELLNDDKVSFGPTNQQLDSNTSTSVNNPYKKKNTSPSYPSHGCLERWARQGVLLLNTVLTVRKGVANSHAKQGWEQFTDHVIELLHDEYTKSYDEEEEGKKGLVFLLWGKPASKKAERILSRPSGKKHTVICTSHPSPLGATKTKSPFLGSKCFSRANEALIEKGLSPIDWNVDGELP